MFNFQDIVYSLLTEDSNPGQPGHWWTNVIKVYNTNNRDLPPLDSGYPSGDLEKNLSEMVKSGGNLSYNYNKAYVPLVDLIRKLYKTGTSSTIPALKTASSNIKEFIDKIEANKEDKNIQDDLAKWYAKVKNKDFEDYAQSAFLSNEVQEAERKRTEQINALGQIAFNTIENLTIVDAVQEIVKRRTDAVRRLTALKSISKPFGNLIHDIFNFTSQYITGQNPITSDFAEIVDGNLYIGKILMIAVLSRQLFDDLIKPRTKETPGAAKSNQPEKGEVIQPKLGNTPTAQLGYTPPGQRAAESWNTFYALVDNLICESNSNFKPLNESAILTAAVIAGLIAPIGLGIINWVKKAPQDPNYMNFVEKGILPGKEKGKEQLALNAPNTNPNTAIINPGPQSQQQAQVIYNLKKIEEIQNEYPSAKQLVEVFQEIAQYQRENTGVMDRMAAGANAAAGLAAVGGIKAGLAG